MTRAIDVTGHRYGRLTAQHRVPSEGRRTIWRFHCDCGTVMDVDVSRVRSGIAQSCGCYRAEMTASRSLKHGHSVGAAKGVKQSRTLKSYQHAKQRCTNPRNPKFPYYGGRGISMCETWTADFRNFLADMGECPPNKTLDRINPHGNYEPGNCRWATSSEQARTRTDNVIVYHEGCAMILKDFARLMGVEYKTLHARVRYRGMTPANAVLGMRRFPPP